MTPQEFERIYSSIWKKLNRLASQFGKAANVNLDAEDIAQEALIALWELSEQGYPIRDPEALLVKITKVTCISHMRKRKLQTIPIDGDNYNGGESATIGVEKMDEATVKKKLYECLTRTERKYMSIKTEEGLTLDELATRTGADKSGISTALSKARKKLKEQFKKSGYGR